MVSGKPGPAADPYGGLSPETFTETHIVRLRAGRVCEYWLQVDLLGLLNQLRA